MTEPELKCQELVELITDYFEGMLSSSERARFEAHLSVCTGCRNYLDQMRRTIDTLGKLKEEELEPAMRVELLELFREWKRDA